MSGERVAIAALAAAVAAFAFQQTAVVPAIPTIQGELGGSQAWTAWLLSGYLVASAVATPLLGKLGDRFGKRRILVVSLLVFLAGSVGAAVAPSLAWLIAARTVQGAGGAVFPLALAIGRDALSPSAARLTAGLLTGAFGLGTSAGVGLSGVLVEVSSWRAVFAAGGVVVAIALAGTLAGVPRTAATFAARLDLRGGLLLTGGLGLVLVALTEGPLAGWGSAAVIGPALAGAALLVAWVARSLRVTEPLLDVRLLAARPVLLTNTASVLLGYVLFGVYFLVPYFVRGDPAGGYGFGAGPLQAGLFLLPAAAGQAISGPLAGLVARRADPRWPFAAGMALAAGGAGALAAWNGTQLAVLLATFALGIGVGAATGVASALVAEAADTAHSGVATSLNSVLRRVGGAVGSQVAAALLAAITLGGGAPAERAFVIAFGAAAVIGVAGAALALGVRTKPARA